MRKTVVSFFAVRLRFCGSLATKICSMKKTKAFVCNSVFRIFDFIFYYGVITVDNKPIKIEKL